MSKKHGHTCATEGPQPYPVTLRLIQEPEVKLEIDGSVMREPVTSLPSCAVSFGE